MMFGRRTKIGTKLRHGFVVAMLCISLSVMQPREAHAQTVVINPIQHAWEILNAAAQMAFQHAENLISWMVVSSGLTGVVNAIEIQVEAAHRHAQAVIDANKLAHNTALAAAHAAAATPSDSTPACATQNAHAARNASGNQIGGLVKMVTATVALHGKGKGAAAGTPADAVANNCAGLVGKSYNMYDAATYGTTQPCKQQ